MIRAKEAFAVVVLTLQVCSAAPLTLRRSETLLSIDPSTLSIRQRSGRGWIQLVGAGPSQQVRLVTATRDTAKWSSPTKSMTVTAALTGKGLDLTFESTMEQVFELPLMAPGAAKALIVPESEGWYIPVREPFWVRLFAEKQECRATSGVCRCPSPAWKRLKAL